MRLTRPQPRREPCRHHSRVLAGAYGPPIREASFVIDSACAALVTHEEEAVPGGLHMKAERIIPF